MLLKCFVAWGVIFPTFEKSDGVFVLGWFFLLQTNFDFITSSFWRNYFIALEKYCCFELEFLKNIFRLWSFFVNYVGLKIVNLGQLARDLFRAVNSKAEIQSFSEIVKNWLKQAFCHNCFVIRSKIYQCF